MKSTVEAGDLIIFNGRGLTSRVIEWATRGPSHVGIVCPIRCRLLLFESTTLCPHPCEITGQRVDGVQAHGVGLRVHDYAGRAQRLRLAKPWFLSRVETHELREFLVPLLGQPYDVGRALLSGTRLFKWTSLMPYPDLGTYFCSELCATALMRLGRLPPGDPAVYNPASLVRTLLRSGVYLPPEPIGLPSSTHPLPLSPTPSLP